MFRTLAVSLLSLLLCASVAFAEKPLVVASDPTFPPNEMLNKDKEIVGFSIDYIKAVGKEAGFDVQVKNIAWDGIFAALASNQVDVIAASVSITDKRKKAMLFTDPYYELHQAVVLPLGKEIKDLEELAGKRVGGQIGTTAMVQTIPASKIKMIVKTYDEVGLAFEDLAKGNIDAVICDDPVAKFYANKKQEYAGKLKVAFITDDVEFYGFAVRKSDTDLVKKLNEGIKAVKEKGIDKQVVEKWIGK
jgi:polar amino acid transport system substrate-binding protein